GDSITHYWQKNVMCKTDGQESWDKYWGNYYVENFGIGSDRTQHVLYRLQNGNLDGIMPKAIVLMIGTNNTSSGHKPEDIILGITDIIKEITVRCPRTRIIIYDIFPRLRNAPQAVENNKATNLLLKKLADGKRVIHASIYDQLLDKDGNANKEIFFDGIHMTNAGYEIWAKDVLRLLKKYNIKLRTKEKK
ncbi:MAG: GDSL-type esterase/lipase family protein, partial [Lentisphaeria bacterium]